MKRHSIEEHVLHENPFIDDLRRHLEASHPHRLEQLSPIDIAVIAAGMQEVKVRYGESSSTPLKYHDELHTREAFEDYCVYADIFNLSAEEFVDGALAVSWHDWEQSLGPGLNEAASAVELQRVMSASGYDTPRQQHAANCILATEVIFDEQGNMVQKHLKTFGPDRTLLAVTMADMYGITIHGEQTMIDHAFRLAMEINHMSFQQLREDPARFIDMLKNQYPFVGTRLSTLSDSIHFHIDSDEEAEIILTQLNTIYGGESSRAINAAKSIYEAIDARREDVTRLIGSFAAKASDEAAFVGRVTSYATQQAIARITRDSP